MFEISYYAFFFIIIIMMIIGGLVALLFDKETLKIKESEKVTICYDYKTSKDYDRLYELLNGGHRVLVRPHIDKWSLHNTFYTAFKSHREEYYLGSFTEYLPDKEKFIYYCKFKEIEFLDFIN